MEMENHHQYSNNISDLRQFITRATSGSGQPVVHYPSYSGQQQQLLLPELMTAHHHHHLGLTTTPPATIPHHHYGTVAGGGRSTGHQYQDHFNCDSNTTTTTTTTTNTTTNNQLVSSFDAGGGDCGVARWPRQETLTLLEIRSRLDHKFKEANQKGPLWDELARIMCEEHGYQRSGKKCREKFENLYKYYKKTKEGKAGRQDGKHYRFFRQLEALYGEQHQLSENTPHFQTHHPTIPTQVEVAAPSVSLSNSSDFETSSSENDDDGLNGGGSMESHGSMKRKKSKRNWKVKIKEFIDLQMRKIMEKQENWLDKMMTTLENRENERMVREEEWRKKEVERVEREHKFWAGERAWIEARDSALMSALDKFTNNINNNNVSSHQWPEHEVTRLIQVRTSMESRFQQCGFSEEVLWEDIATKMAYLGYDRSPIVCKEKWDNLNNYFRENKGLIKDEGKKKRKENYGGIIHNSNNNNEGGIYMNQLSGFNNNCEINEPRLQLNEGSSSPSSHNSNANNNNNNNNNNNVNSGVGNVMNDNCLRFFLGDGENTLGWESNYGLKLNNGDNQCA